MHHATTRRELGHDPTRPPVLEVEQRWGEVLLDTRHYAPGGPDVTVGSGMGWRWSLLGVRMGWVAPPLHRVVGVLPPLWSDVEQLPRDEFHAPDDALPGGMGHPLVTWDDDRWVVESFGPWPLQIRIQGEPVDLDALVAAGGAERSSVAVRVPVTPGTEVAVEIGELRFDVRLVPEATRVLSRGDVREDAPFLAHLSVTGFLGLMLAVFLWSQPPPPQTAMVELPDRFAELMLQVDTPPPPAPTPKGDSMQHPGAAHDDQPEANQEVRRKEKRMGGRDATTVHDHEVASQAGIFGSNAASGLDALAGTGLNTELTGAIDGMNGPRHAAFGGGLGDRGPCCGHGGTADRGDGDRIGTHGAGDGDHAYGTPDGPGKTDGALVIAKDPIVIGGLTREEIDEVVKRHLQRIRYCYQQQFQKDPTLGGTVKVKFVIGKDGSVSSAETTQTTLHSEAAETCIESRFMEMTFPKPRGGGLVIVAYPFHFSGGT